MKYLIKFRKTIMTLAKILTVLAVTCGFVEVWQSAYPYTIMSGKGNYIVLLMYLVLFVVFANLYGGFRIGINRLHEIIYSLSLAVIFTNFIMYLALSLIISDLIVIPPFLLGIVYQIGVVFIMSYCCNRIYFSLYAARKMLAVFADDEQGKTLIRKMSKIPERFKIERGVSLNRHSVEEIKELIDSYEAVILSEFEKSAKDELLRYCYSNGKRVYLLPSSTDIIVNNSATIQIFDTPVLMCRARGLTTEQAVIKRAMDVFVSALGILVTWPIMLGFAIAIKLCDGGPVLFKQNRITKDGKVFNVLKFRSMIPDADKNEVKGTTDNDDRITPVGKIMRPIRVDELPQLFNILFGDMSLVGPRPERIENVYQYTKAYPDFDLRHRVKGGLTGYAQIYGKYNTSPEDKLNMDLIYIEQYSLLMDIKLILMTIKILFMKESTEGFTEKNNVVIKKARKKLNLMSFNATLVVMAAGMGSRFGGLKQIEPIGPKGEALLDFSVYDAKKAGFTKVVFVIKHEIEKDFKEIVGKRVEKVLPTEYVFQEVDDLPEGFTCPEGRTKPWGTGQAILCCKDTVKEPFAIINADDYYGQSAFKKIYDQLKADSENYCVVGYRLANTLTENGTVSRGVCVVEDGFLKKIDERTKIQDCKYTEDDGKTWVEMPEDTVVSMNFWGLTPDIFDFLEREFKTFLNEKINVPKSEFYIPIVIGDLVKNGEKAVKVLVAEDRWYGVTYKEDKPAVVKALGDIVASGAYENL